MANAEHLGDDERVRRDEAEARASELNREVGASREVDGYYIEVEISPGEWTVTKRIEPEKRSVVGRLFDALMQSGGTP